MSDVKRPYLIQRGVYRKYEGYVSLYTAVAMDYMGSAEFEGGEQSRSLERMFDNRENLKVRLVDLRDVDPNVRVMLKVFSYLDDEQFRKYVESIKQLRAGTNQFRLKEGSRFDKVTQDRGWSRVNFWWDIQQDVMWTFHSQANHDFPYLLQESWKKMGLIEQTAE